MELYQILYAVHTGTMPKIPRSMKNKVNASQEFFSPYGYTAIQVDIDGRLRNYAARSLLRIDAQPFEGQDNVRTM